MPFFLPAHLLLYTTSMSKKESRLSFSVITVSGASYMGFILLCTGRDSPCTCSLVSSKCISTSFPRICLFLCVWNDCFFSAFALVEDATTCKAKAMCIEHVTKVSLLWQVFLPGAVLGFSLVRSERKLARTGGCAAWRPVYRPTTAPWCISSSGVFWGTSSGSKEESRLDSHLREYLSLTTNVLLALSLFHFILVFRVN